MYTYHKLAVVNFHSNAVYISKVKEMGMNPGLLVGAGFLLGSVGVKALNSKKAKKLYVKGIVQGMRAKEEVQTMVDEARAEFDDLLAEAGYAKELEDGEEGSTQETSQSEDEEEGEENDDKSAKKMKTTSVFEETAKQVKKAAVQASKSGMAKSSGRGGHGHGHGRAGK